MWYLIIRGKEKYLGKGKVDMNRIILMKVLGMASAEHHTAKRQAELIGDERKRLEEDEIIENIHALARYIIDHEEVGDYQ